LETSYPYIKDPIYPKWWIDNGIVGDFELRRLLYTNPNAPSIALEKTTKGSGKYKIFF